MRKVYTAEKARFLLAEADAMIAGGAIQADVCRELRVSHVIYQRLRNLYGGGGWSTVGGGERELVAEGAARG